MNKEIIIAIKSLLRYKNYIILNIVGLTIGLTSFVLILTWVQDELSFDSFHKDADRIYTVFRVEESGKEAVTSTLLAPTIQRELPEIISATGFIPLPEAFQSTISYNENSYMEHFAVADSSFFDVFSFQIIEGSGSEALKNPNSIVISERVSQKYFGNDKALGKTLTINFIGIEQVLYVTAVIRNYPSNSHIQSEIIVPCDLMNNFGLHWNEWYNQNPRTYIKTIEGVSLADLERKILNCKQKYFKEDNLSYSLLPLRKIHLHTSDVAYLNSVGDIRYVYIFSAIGFVILLIAGMNYVNLSNVLSLKRSKEIGLKKTFGIRRIHIVKQSYIETLLLTVISTILALLLSQIFLPLVNKVSGKDLFIHMWSLRFMVILLTIIFLTTFLSGFYPAVFMSGFKPIKALNGKIIKGKDSLAIRKGIVVFQFALSIIIIICTLAISNQLKFIRNTNLGYDKENLLYVLTNGKVSENYKTFRSTVIESGLVKNVSHSNVLDGTSISTTSNVNWPGKTKDIRSKVIYADKDFASTYDIQMDAGEFFKEDFITDKDDRFVINQKAAREMGFFDPIDQQFEIWGRKGKIIGVTKDFHFSSFHDQIEPLVFILPRPEELDSRCRVILFKLKPNNLRESLNYLKNTWEKFYPKEQFNFAFVDEQVNSKYISENRMSKLFNYFSVLAIFVACLGLFGLTSFTIEQKNKEIGVHKVIGAKEFNVMYLLSKDYIIWITIAFIIASPVSYYFMNLWLKNFVYKTDLSWWIFAVSGLLVVFLAVLTVSWQSFQAARRNPIEALRYE